MNADGAAPAGPRRRGARRPPGAGQHRLRLRRHVQHPLRRGRPDGARLGVRPHQGAGEAAVREELARRPPGRPDRLAVRRARRLLPQDDRPGRTREGPGQRRGRPGRPADLDRRRRRRDRRARRRPMHPPGPTTRPRAAGAAGSTSPSAWWSPPGSSRQRCCPRRATPTCGPRRVRRTRCSGTTPWRRSASSRSATGSPAGRRQPPPCWPDALLTVTVSGEPDVSGGQAPEVEAARRGRGGGANRTAGGRCPGRCGPAAPGVRMVDVDPGEGPFAALGGAGVVGDREGPALGGGVQPALAAEVEGLGGAAEHGRDDPGVAGQPAGLAGGDVRRRCRAGPRPARRGGAGGRGAPAGSTALRANPPVASCWWAGARSAR